MGALSAVYRKWCAVEDLQKEARLIFV